MKTFIKLTIILTILLSLTACKAVDKENDYKDAVIGNTSGNTNNGSTMLEFDGWVYYSIGSFAEDSPYVTPDDGFYRMRPNGTEKQKISDTILGALNGSGDAIYSASNQNSIFKTSLADLTTDKMDLNPGLYSFRLLAMNDRLIFSNSAANYALFSMKNDGSDFVKLSTQPSFRADFNQGWVYYVTEAPVELHRVYIDGTQDALISNDVGKDFIIVNDMIYYPSLADGNRLYAMSLLGENPVKITENAVSSLNSDGNQLFYIDPIDRYIHALSFNGKVDTLISQHVAHRISIAGGWIYYSDNQAPAQLFQVSLSNWTERVFYSLKVDTPEISEVENTGMAISNENFYSGGYFAQSKDWIYYSDMLISNSEGLFKIHADGSGKTKISDVHARNLAILGDWIYFINNDQESKIYRIKTDGSELTLVLDIPTVNFLVNDNWIVLTTGDGGVIKVKTNGTERIDLFYLPHDYSSKLYAIANNKVYRDDGGQVVGMDLSGNTTSRMVSNDFGIDNIVLHNDWIFYIVSTFSEDLTDKLFKAKLDGTSITLVETFPLGGRTFGFYDNWLYFTNKNDNEALVRLDVESGKREVLVRGKEFTHLYFLDGRIVSIRTSDTSWEVFISDLDGSNSSSLIQ